MGPVVVICVRESVQNPQPVFICILVGKLFVFCFGFVFVFTFVLEADSHKAEAHWRYSRLPYI